jgi:hypothetical protein
MSFYIYQPGGSRDFDRRIVPPYKPGLYRLEYTFEDYGFWEVSLRSGIGLDRYYGEINLDISDGTQTFTRRSIFHGDLETTTPQYIQSIGFAVFGVLLLITLVLVGSLLRWLKVHHHSTA